MVVLFFYVLREVRKMWSWLESTGHTRSWKAAPKTVCLKQKLRNLRHVKSDKVWYFRAYAADLKCETVQNVSPPEHRADFIGKRGQVQLEKVMNTLMGAWYFLSLPVFLYRVAPLKVLSVSLKTPFAIRLGRDEKMNFHSESCTQALQHSNDEVKKWSRHPRLPLLQRGVSWGHYGMILWIQTISDQVFMTRGCH